MKLVRLSLEDVIIHWLSGVLCFPGGVSLTCCEYAVLLVFSIFRLYHPSIHQSLFTHVYVYMCVRACLLACVLVCVLACVLACVLVCMCVFSNIGGVEQDEMKSFGVASVLHAINQWSSSSIVLREGCKALANMYHSGEPQFVSE